MQAVTGPGRVVAGRYRLLDQIGHGAMGTVWRARDLVLARGVAVKQVRLPEVMTAHEREILRERTLREARVSAKLSHPGLVTVHDVIEADGTPWIVMELVAARSLEQVLAEEGPLPPHQAAETGVMLLGALASAHAVGIVHRDVKPANVLVTPDGRAVLTDFGIATLDGDPGLTQAGMVMGTPGFCAPERIRGEPASPASDLWSLGATLYAAVEGRGPFDGLGSPMAVLASIVHSDPPPTRSAGPLGTVIGALLNKDPAQRPDAACAARLLADAATAGIPSGAGTVAGVRHKAAGKLAGAGSPSLPAEPDLAEATASTWPSGFPGGIGPPTFRPGTGPAELSGRMGASGYSAGPAAPLPPTPAAPLPASPGMSFPPSTAAPLPASLGTPLPAGPGAGEDWLSFGGRPAVDGTANLPRSPDQPGHRGRASHAGAPSRRSHRGLTLTIAGVAIICAGLVIGVIVSLATRPSSHPPAGPAPGQNGAGATGQRAIQLPPGYHWYDRSAATAGTAAGFSIAVPDGWQAHRQGTATYLLDPASGGAITVTPEPPGTAGPLREARLLEHAALSVGSYPGYRRVGISPFLLHGAVAAGWRFDYRQPGSGAMDALDVITQVTAPADHQPYELLVTAPSAHWPATRNVFLKALATFSPHSWQSAPCSHCGTNG